jgi:predicted RNase H-like HicB family nuclease
MTQTSLTLEPNNQIIFMHANSYLVVIESGKRNFSAYSPDVPGCVTTGRTVDETLKHMREALTFHLEDEDTIPEPRGLAWHLADDAELSDETLAFAHIPVDEVAPLALA